MTLQEYNTRFEDGRYVIGESKESNVHPVFDTILKTIQGNYKTLCEATDRAEWLNRQEAINDI
jgi:hypothetical protein